MGSNLKDDFEPYWDDEKDWLCTVEFLPRDDPEARSFSAEIIGYLFGYAHLTNTRSLALLGDPDANAYELLFSVHDLAFRALSHAASPRSRFATIGRRLQSHSMG